jgi:prenyltransferase beta subunit
MADAGSPNLVIFQKAAAAARVLDDPAREAVVEYLFSQETGSGLFQDRNGQPDVYYTFFALAALIALNREPDLGRLQRTLREMPADTLDLIHLSCLLRLRLWCDVLRWIGLKRMHQILLSPSLLYRFGGKALRLMRPSGTLEPALFKMLAGFRASDGGFAMRRNAGTGNPYAAFLAWQTYADAGMPMPGADVVLRSIIRCRARDGGFAGVPGMEHGTTPVTAAVALLQQALFAEPEPALADWLTARRHPGGGFLASPTAPVPDLLSTGVTLFTLQRLGRPLCACNIAAATDFVTLHWNDNGGFCGTLTDPRSDCEYTFYALLALGCLT